MCAHVLVCGLVFAQVHVCVCVYTWKPEVDASVFLNHSLSYVLRKDLMNSASIASQLA